jgi:hypothetical protein
LEERSYAGVPESGFPGLIEFTLIQTVQVKILMLRGSIRLRLRNEQVVEITGPYHALPARCRPLKLLEQVLALFGLHDPIRGVPSGRVSWPRVNGAGQSITNTASRMETGRCILDSLWEIHRELAFPNWS